MSLLEIKIGSLQAEQLSQVVELDKNCLGGLWSREGYQRELESPNSSLIVLSISPSIRPLVSSNLLETNSSVSTIPYLQDARHAPLSTFVANEQIIGCGCFWAILEEAHITLLMIDPDYQGKGLGQLLLYSLLEDAYKRQLERATLEVRVSNEVAISLYKKFGFKIAGRRKGYYQTTGEDALILWRGDLHRSQFEQDLKAWQKQISDRLAKNHWQLEEIE
ncbi:ribosomal protein S18-alanine N-acetyltransferase [Candidatus Gracilibacteria bacterium]|jgi:[ribosomal protein S18]-alanine N-acetyltransferase|nr:ribosomal protein S18-alanine N-acetyltransferase [Candidatus Gracilibacteria bacterium]NJM86324.1 ribosomal protein S18-alanine N-acetyltransferase [Hydrococcus sp. RU_2_2]NJP19650.1 ribosomal protein S18-alanine N-acetyltransferase [Hydrococcus sp. CRU_1_1]